MRICCHKIPICVAVVLFLSFSSGFPADMKQYSALPPGQITKKWRIGYLEGGQYKDYRKVLLATVEGLSGLGWIEKISIPEHEIKDDNRKLWAWLAVNAKSKYMEFVADAFYSDNWNNDLRQKNRTLVLRRLNKTRDIDLMLAYGTWSGQDLANNEHSVPTVICSVSDAVASGIVKSAHDSGYDHVHARLDPTRYERQIRAFHDVIGFGKLGVAFENTKVGRSYAAIGDMEKVAKERNFGIIKCDFGTHDISEEEAEAGITKCAAELAPKIDAFYITASAAITPKSLPKILESMNACGIPTFSQVGIDEVRLGVLLSVSSPNSELSGRFHAETIAKIINGAKPRDLDQVYESPVSIAFNAATAIKIGLKPEIFDLLSQTAEKVYEAEAVGK